MSEQNKLDSLPSDPALRKVVKDAAKEWCDSTIREDSEKELKKTIIETASDKSNVKKSVLGQIFKLHMTETYGDKEEREKREVAIEQLEEYDTIFNPDKES